MSQSPTQRTTGSTRVKGPFVVTLRGAGSKGKDYTLGGVAPVGAGLDVGLSVQMPSGQVANAFQVEEPDSGNATGNPPVASVPANILMAIGPTGGLQLGSSAGVVPSYQSYRVQVACSAALLEAINTTNIPLVASPGAGYAIRVDRCTAEVVATGLTPFTTAYAAYPVYAGATTALVSGTLTAAQGESSTSTLVDMGGPVAAGIALTPNVGVSLYSATNWSNSGTPTASVIVTLDYTVIKLT